MARGTNAQKAVQLFDQLAASNGWGAADAWKGIAELLLTCQRQHHGKWEDFYGVVVYRESNDFKTTKKGPNATITRAGQLTRFLAIQLGCQPDEVCARIGRYWREPTIAGLQQHNLVGHAFRSLIVRSLEHYGAKGIRYEEELAAREIFPGYKLTTRSVNPSIDIVALRGDTPVAMLSSRWRFRHDRVDVPEEALAYQAPASRVYGGLPYYAVVGEFSAARIAKILAVAPPLHPQGPVNAAVHFNPELLTQGLGENGRIAALRSLEWLIAQTHTW